MRDWMVSGFDIIGHNKPLQEHWLKRIVAAIIDWIIISIPFWLFNFLHSPAYWIWTSTIGAGLIWMVYSAVLEGTRGATFGKQIMDLKVESLFGANLDMARAFERNVSKIFGLFLLIDWIMGMATEGDPRQRYLDRLANTTVIHSNIPVPYVAPPHYQDHQPPPPPSSYQPQPKPAYGKCRECRGELEELENDKVRCKKCGTIQ